LAFGAWRLFQPQLWNSRLVLETFRETVGELMLYSSVISDSDFRPAIRISANSRCLVASICFFDRRAQRIKDAGIDIIGYNTKLGPNASIGEIDIETPNAIVEVTVQKGGKLTQIRELMGNPQLNPTGKPIILYAPNYLRTAGKAVSDAGGSVARTPEELINLLRSKETP
jgi:hypothetical protein